MQIPNLEDTIVAIATPPGVGAIGIVRLSGPQAIPLTASLASLSNGLLLQALPSQKSAFSVLRDNGTRVDQVMVTIFRTPKSYTGEDVVEISCHGGSAVLKKILDLFLGSGARLAEPGEFSQRAFINGKMDLSQAEAVADLIHAQTESSRAAALSHLEGGLSAKIIGIRESLIEILAHIEVSIDHSDDTAVGDIMHLTVIRKKLEEVCDTIQQLIQSYAFGRLLRDGIRIAIVGKPNAGKSSLLNRLLKSDRAIVTAVPGTTRDVIEEGFDLLGIPAILTDTAGIRDNVSDLVEEIGIQRTLKSVESSDMVIVVLDGSELLSSQDRRIAELIQNKNKRIGLIAINKCDLPMQIPIHDAVRLFPEFPCLEISSLKDQGIEELLKQLYKLALGLAPGYLRGHSGLAPESMVSARSQFSDSSFLAQEILVTSIRHRDCLVRSLESLRQALKACESQTHEECMALEIQEALSVLGEIIGETVTEDVLQAIFSKFCIGK